MGVLLVSMKVALSSNKTVILVFKKKRFKGLLVLESPYVFKIEQNRQSITIDKIDKN